MMFTDTVGFTGLGRRDEGLKMRLLGEQRGLVRPILARHRGREVKTTGDGFLVEFSSAQDAVRCSLDIQSSLFASNAGRPEGEQMFVRIGIHLGDVIHQGTDVAGEEALQVLTKLEERAKSRYVPSYWIAVIYNGLRDRDQTISWLRKAFDERSSWLVWAKVEPRFDWLRGDADFESMLGSMKFP